MLTRMTQGLLEGDVRSSKGYDRIAHELLIRVPSLDNYVYSLLVFNHSVDLYPVSILFMPTQEGTEAKNVDDLAAQIKRYANHDATKKILSSLYAQAKG
jgi:hypothetical protein